jgi:hypothetical protein
MIAGDPDRICGHIIARLKQDRAIRLDEGPREIAAVLNCPELAVRELIDGLQSIGILEVRDGSVAFKRLPPLTVGELLGKPTPQTPLDPGVGTGAGSGSGAGRQVVPPWSTNRRPVNPVRLTKLPRLAGSPPRHTLAALHAPMWLAPR